MPDLLSWIINILSWLKDDWNIISAYPIPFICCATIFGGLTAIVISFIYKKKIKQLERDYNSLKLEYDALKDSFSNSGLSARLYAGVSANNHSVSAKKVSEHIKKKIKK